MTTSPACPDCLHSDAHSRLAGCTWSDALAFCTCSTAWTAPKTLATARAEADEAMERVEAATDPGWLAHAADAVAHLARPGMPAFSTDDVWHLLAERKVAPPAEPRAIGPVMKTAVRSGLLVQDGYTQSVRRHASVIRTYVGANA